MSSFMNQRRKFLKALGLTTASLPFYPLLESSVVHGQDAQPPLRLLLFYTGFGGVWDYLRPKGLSGKDAALTPESLTFEHSILEPLKDFIPQMTLIEGMSYSAGLIALDERDRVNSRTPLIGHENTAPNCFTGSPTVNKGDEIQFDVYATGPSLEYVLGQKLGGQTAVRSLQLGIGAQPGASHFETLAYNESGQRLPGITDAKAAFRQLFGDVGGGGSSSGGGDASAARKLEQEQSVMKAVRASAERLRGRLAGSERAKLDEHLAALADIEARLSSQQGPSAPPPISCGTPSPPGETPRDASESFPEMTDLHFDIIAQALACDRTRFITTAWGVTVNQPTWLFGTDVSDMHNDVAHVIDAEGDQGLTARLRLAKLNNWYASRLAALMTRLQSVSEGDGTVLDNTLIVWAQDFGWDVHGGLNVPYVLLGGAQKKFRMGRYLNVRRGKEDGDYKTYTPNNNLLVSIMNAFGVEGDSFGTDEFRGTLTGLT